MQLLRGIIAALFVFSTSAARVQVRDFRERIHREDKLLKAPSRRTPVMEPQPNGTRFHHSVVGERLAPSTFTSGVTPVTRAEQEHIHKVHNGFVACIAFFSLAILLVTLAYSYQTMRKSSFPEKFTLQQIMSFSHNGNPDSYGDTTAHALLHQLASEMPSAIAVIDGELSLTYQELSSKANDLAGKLASCEPGFVGLLLFPSAEMIVAIFGVLTAGHCYVPLDLSWPKQRIQYIASHTSILIANSDSELSLPATTQVWIFGKWPEMSTRSCPQRGPEDLCYMMFTSGTSGKPKGVLVEHRGVVHRAQAMQETYNLKPGQKMMLKHSIVFGLSEYEIFWTLTCGATLVVLPQGCAKDPAMVVRASLAHRPPVQVFVPSVLRMFLETAQDVTPDVCGMQQVLTCGEALPPSLMHELWSWSGQCRLDNHYGPTEGEQTMYLCNWECKGREITSVPIGRPILGSSAFVVDDGALCGINEVGEICFGGPFIARGYLNKQLEQRAFVVSHACGGRVYQTGDLAKWREDGILLSIGRRDNQIKLRGFRIELGEVEAALLQAGAKEAVVQLVGDGEAAQLVAHVAPVLNPAGLEQSCRSILPAFMIPRVMPLPALPRNTSGKVDKGQLPMVSGTDSIEALVQPQNKIEHSIQKIWADVLKLEISRISVLEDFMTLGGNSMAAGLMMAQVRRRLRVDLPAAVAYKHNTIRKLAEAVQADAKVESTEHEPRDLRISAVGKQWMGHSPSTFTSVMAQFFCMFLGSATTTVRLVIAVGTIMALHRSCSTLVFYVCLPFVTLLFEVVDHLLVLVLKYTVVGTLKPGTYPVWGLTYIQWLFQRSLLKHQHHRLQLFSETCLINWFYRLSGSSIGWGVTIKDGVHIETPELVIIGEGTTLELGVQLGAVSFQDGLLTLRRVEIGSCCILEAKSFLLEGILPSGSRLPSGCTAKGNDVSLTKAMENAKLIKTASGPSPKPRSLTQELMRLLIGLPTLGLLISLGYMCVIPLMDLCGFDESGGDHSVQHHASMAILWIYVWSCVEGLMMYVGVLILKKIVIGRLDPMALNEAAMFKRWLFSRAVSSQEWRHFVDQFTSTEIQSYLFRLMGMKVGRRVQMDLLCTSDFENISVEDYVTLAHRVAVAPRQPDSLGAVRFMNHSAIFDTCFIRPGVVVGEHAILGSNTYAPDDSYYAPRSVSVGCTHGQPVPIGTKRTPDPKEQQLMDDAFQSMDNEFYFWSFNICMCIVGIVTFPIHEILSLLPAAIVIKVAPCAGLSLLYFVVANFMVDIIAVMFFILAKWVVLGRIGGNHPCYSFYHMRWLSFNAVRLSLNSVFSFTEGTVFHSTIWRLLGAKVGKCSVLLSETPEFDLYQLGDYSIDAGVTYHHTLENMVLKFAPTRVGKHCTIQPHSLMMPGCTLEDYACILQHCCALKGEIIGSGQCWAGNPGRAVAMPNSLHAQQTEQIPEAAIQCGVISLFSKQVSQRPNDIVFLERESSSMMTYCELAGCVNSLAGALTERVGIRKGDVVGLLLQPSRSFVVATLAVMKSTATWLPLDTQSPGPRLQVLLQRAGARIALVQHDSLIGLITPLPALVLSANGALALDVLVNTLHSGNYNGEESSLVGFAPDIAAIFYTSGSSGEPKAVMYGHDTICHGALTFGNLCQADESSVFLIKTPILWAVIEYEVFTPLIFGARAVVSADSQRDIAKLTHAIFDHNVSILVTSAPVLQMLVGETLPSLRHAVNVGGVLPLDVCAAVTQAFGSSLLLHNLYGCTETPCLQWTYDRAALASGQKFAPAGLPQPGTEVHVLDENWKPVPPGTQGQIFIGGPYLSHGYFGDERLTNERFILPPSGERVYCTGDVGRWVYDACGTLVLQVEGRSDRQLNIRGIRISPEEIEVVLSQVAGIKEVAVIEGARQTIVAGIAGIGFELEAAVNQHAMEYLPPHMRPAVVVMLDCLPKLSNGKVDLVAMAKLASAKASSHEKAEVEALDSLGMMRKVKRQEAAQLQVISALRGWASIHVVLYHVWACTFSKTCDLDINEEKQQLWEAQGPHKFRVLLTGFMNLDCSLAIFIIAAGYQDSMLAPKSKWRENLMVLILLLLCATAVPWLFCFGDSECVYGSIYGPRWYLQYYLLCNMLHSSLFLPLRERVPKKWLAVVKVAVVILTCRLSTLLHHINICRFGHTLNQVARYFSVEECRLVPFTSTTTAFFGLIQTGYNETWLFPLYSVVWWYGPFLVVQLTKHFERLCWQGFAAALFCMAYWAGSDDHYGQQLFFAHDCLFGARFHLVGLVSALLVVLTCALGSMSAWFPMASLEYLGRCSLGTYLGHWYVVVYRPPLLGPPFLTEILPAFGGWPGDGLLKFVLCILYPALFAATFGYVFRIFLVDSSAFLVDHLGKAGCMVAASFRRVYPRLQHEQAQAVKQAHQRWHQLCTHCFDLGGVLCIDGGTGSEVQREVESLGDHQAGNSAGWSCIQWKTHPDVLRGVHLNYLRSGANVVIANSYATNRHIMKAAGCENLTCKATITAMGLACEARDAFVAESCAEACSESCAMLIPTLVAGSMSCHPPGMEHGANMDMGKWPLPEVEKENYLEQAQLLRDGGADVIFVEMVWEWEKHGAEAVRSAIASGLPVVVCFAVFDAKSCEEEMPQLHDGNFLVDVAREIASGDGWANVVGICVHHTKLPLVLPCLMAIRRGGWEGIVGAYPDHGTFEMPHWRFEPLEADKIVICIAEWVAKARCQIVGGCCGIGPDTIKIISRWCRAFNIGKKIHFPDNVT